MSSLVSQPQGEANTLQPTSKESPALIRGLGKHLPALDGLRGLAILLVLFHHFTPNIELYSGAFKGVHAIFNGGWSGVDLFFVLSGFLITGILYDTKGEAHYFRNFYMRRTLRIFPLYYGVLIMMFFVLPWFSTEIATVVHQAGNQKIWIWFYGTNILITLADNFSRLAFVPHFWSLAVEEHFYLVWPAVIFLLPRGRIIKTCLALLVLAFACRWAFFLGGSDGVAPYVFTFCRMDSLAYGGLLAVLARIIPAQSLIRWAYLSLGISVPVILTIAIRTKGLFEQDFWMSVFGFSAFYLLWGACILLALALPETSVVRRIASSKFLRLLGKYSYGIYVFHFLIAEFFELHLPTQAFIDIFHSKPLAFAAQMALGMILSFICAFLSWHLYEKHFLQLKKYFEYRKIKPTAQPGI